MDWIVTFAASFFGAALAALGMGGGGIFIIYLTVFLNMPQLEAQGMNLVFFVPVAVVALIFHAKNKLIKWEVVLPCVLAGLPGVWLGAVLAQWFSQELLGKLFAVFLAVIGLRELLASKSQKN
jgi:uncharacterized membrane protein YfcA